RRARGQPPQEAGRPARGAPLHPDRARRRVPDGPGMRGPGEVVGRLRWGTRTFLTQALVVAASVITAALVALVVGPPLFHEHLLQLGHSGGSAEMAHVEQAFVDAGVRSLGMGLFVALVLALGLAWLETRRLRRPLEQLTAAASLLEAGDYS